MVRNMLTISVVVPAYNEEELLPKCLKSLKKQNFNLPYEIIVVNNNSTDSTARIATKAGVKVVLEKKQGISAARRKGTEVARAEIIAQTDADSVPNKNWLFEIYSVLSTRKDVIAVSGPSYNFGNGGKYTNKIRDIIFNIILFKIGPILIGNGTFRGHNVAYRKSALLKAGGFHDEVAYLDDADLLNRLRKVGKIIINPKQIVMTSARRNEGMSTIGVLLYQAWCAIKIFFTKKPVIGIKNYR